MYFIARNNKIYNFIAQIKPTHRYLITVATIAAFFIVGAYGVYYPLLMHITLYKNELLMLQKKQSATQLLSKNSQELSAMIAEGTHNLHLHASTCSDKQENSCQARLLFIVNTIKTSGLTLDTYGSCTEKDKQWYTKNSAHYTVTGTLDKIIAFIEAIKNSQKMISINHVTITRGNDNSFQMNFDVGLITIKK